ncbi:hypothetical protein ACFSCX_07130 [Bacillus salitolerans]|uniref:DinB family protein n=1 Tax=Bacillus salitolerans TaxID=1437434 RepID=A0ABW4LMC3_9BACI
MENETLKLFINISRGRMYNHYLPKLLQSVQSIKNEDLWEKEMESLNPIGSIVLHICEHINRLTALYTNKNHEGFKSGIEDYFPVPNLPKERVTEIIQHSFDALDTELGNQAVCSPIKIDIHNLFHLVEHTGYHLGQIVDRSKRLTNISYHFCQNGINERNLRLLIEGREF